MTTSNNPAIESLTDDQFNAVMTVLGDKDAIAHSEGKTEEEIDAILATLTPEQVAALEQVLGTPEEEETKEETSEEEQAKEGTSEEEQAKEGNPADPTEPTDATPPTSEGTPTMHNIFENNNQPESIIQHSEEEIKAIFADAAEHGSLHDAVINHGVNKMELLFPEATNVTPGGIQTIHDPLTATDQILGSVRKFPKGRIKTRFANLGATQAEVVENLRAKGYIKGNFKKEQVFDLLGRETNTTTIYKKQAIDRDDLLDLEDFDIVKFYWQEMRMMLKEEIARAILVGDGRSKVGSDGNPNPDHIDDSKLKPIIGDDEFYTLKREYKSSTDLIEQVIKVRKEMLGTGGRTLYTSVGLLDDLTLIKDSTGRYMYDEDALRRQMKVVAIVETSLLPEGEALLGNLNDYTLSGNKGGEMFTADDFDIDYNKYKYLIETRLGGMVTVPKAFTHFTKAATATAPTAGA